MERPAYVVGPMGMVRSEFDDGEDEVVGFVERVENLVLGNGDGGRSGVAPLHLDEPQLARAWRAALDVVAELLDLAVHRLESQVPLDLHHRSSRRRSRRLFVFR